MRTEELILLALIYAGFVACLIVSGASEQTLRQRLWFAAAVYVVAVVVIIGVVVAGFLFGGMLFD